MTVDTFLDRLAALDEAKRDVVLDALYEQRLAALDSAARPDVLPLSPAQLRLWYLTQTDGGDAAYNIPGFFRLTGDIDPDVAGGALAAVAARHEILRSHIVGDPPQMVVSPDPAPEFDVVDASGVDDIEALAAGFLRRPFEMDQPPLWRAMLIHGPDVSHLVLSFHHIVFDGWSLKVFMRDFLTALDGTDLPSLPWQYADYATRDGRRSDLQRQIAALRPGFSTLTEGERFWTERLRELPAPTEWFAGSDRRASGSAGALLVDDLPAELWQPLVTVARQEGATPFAAALAVLYAVMHRRSGADDLVVGTPVSGRNDPKTHDLIGTFVNTVPIRANVTGDLTVRELLRTVTTESVDALAHDDVPFDRIVEIVNPPRSANVHPVFQTLFAFQPAVVLDGGHSIQAEYLNLDFGTAKFDLSLDVIDEQGGVTLLFEYRTDRLARHMVQGVADSYRSLVAAMAEQPDSTISELAVMSDASLSELLARSQGKRSSRRNDDIVTVFRSVAATQPHRQAVTAQGRTLAYGDLDKASDDVAAKVMSAAPTADVLAVLLPRSVELFSSILGVWKAGKTCLVIDPTLPPERIMTMVSDAGATVITERASVVDHFELATVAKAVLVLSELDIASPTVPAAVHSLDAIAYIVYTSGSTGRPKGVQVSHRAYAAMMASWADAFSLDHPECLQIASSSFDVFYGDLARAWGSGGHLRIVEPEVAADVSRLAELVRETKVDFAEFVPSVFRRFAQRLNDTGRQLDIGHLVVASEGWSMTEAQQWRRDVLSPVTRLYNTYGVAEATVDSSIYEVADTSTSGNGYVPIGRPLANVSIYVVDGNGRLVPPGVVGILRIGGDGLSDGYLPSASPADKARFVPLMVDGVETSTYVTGDLGYWDGSGELVLVGRDDDQVKVRGVRIELGEVEEAVRHLPGVTDAAASVVGGAGQERLVAWATTDAAAAETETWRGNLARRLPMTMVPEVLVVDELPYLPSGKIDRAKLGSLEVPRSRRERRNPRTPVETALHQLFAELIGVDDVGIDDSFFALGGHSLTALELVSRVESDLGVRIKVGELFDHPTVESLALRLAELDAGSPERAVPHIDPDHGNRYEPFPLTDVQQAYWLGRDSTFEFSGVATHSYDELQAKGVGIERFTWALNELITRHEMLRAVIIDHDGQRILPEVPRYVPEVYDLRRASQSEIDARLAAIRDELSHQRIDVTTWPTFDIRVSLLPGDIAILHFSTDALMLDAWSFVLVVRELSLISDGESLPDLDFSFRDYVLADRREEGSDRHLQAEQYWRDRIPTLPGAPDLPMARHPDELSEPRFTRLHGRLGAARWASLQREAARRGLTPTGACLTAYAEVLARRLRDPHFTLNLTFLNRKPFHPQVHEVAGEFTSVTLLEVDLTTLPPFEAAAKQIQRDLWEAIEENEMSGVKVLREYARHHDAPTAAHFPVVFTSALAVPVPDADFPAVLRPEHGVTQTSQVWLDAGIWEDHHRELRCNWDVVLEVYPEGFVESMFDDWVTLLGRLADDPTAWDMRPPVTAPPHLEIGDVPPGTLIDPFIASVQTRPDATAVITSLRHITYRELAVAAGRVTAALRSLEVPSGQPVGIVMEPGWEQVACVLGTSAVTAYLPMNPDTPGERLQTITGLAGVEVIFTQSTLKDRIAAEFSGSVICLDDLDGPDDDAAIAALADHDRTPDDLAYVIFTSGSTGVPKGVMIDHRGALNTVVDVNDRYGIGPKDRVLGLSSLSFDLSVYDIFGMLAAGGGLVLPDPDLRLDPLHQIELVEKHRVTVWNTVPALFSLFVGAVESPCESMRIVMLSGDWIPLTLPAAGRKVGTNVEIHSLGGATEASIWSITYPIGDVDPSWSSIPYGKGMKNQDVVVLDRELRPCKTWVPGDLYIRGIGVALGYWGDESRTSDAFITHPTSGERLYRTGDLGRLLPDGNIEFMGRTDFQLKIGGYRVEAGEVERAVLQHPVVAAATVLALGDRLDDKRLACAWTRTPGTSDQPDLATFLTGTLPSYMIPLVFAELEAMPLSSNGKVDRSAIGQQLSHATVTTTPYVAAASPEEQWMVDLWERILGRSTVGLHDDFFQIGGDSIAAIELLTAIRRSSSTEIGLRDLYHARTPAGMVRQLNEGAP